LTPNVAVFAIDLAIFDNVPGVIGAGLFLGTAQSLAKGGPVGLLLGYLVVGTICYSVMVR